MFSFKLPSLSSMDITTNVETVFNYDEIIDTPLDFGKYKGLTLTQIFMYDSNYIKWLAENLNENNPINIAAVKMSNEHGLYNRAGWDTDINDYDDLAEALGLYDNSYVPFY